MNSRVLIILCCLLSLSTFSQSKTTFSKKEVLEDLYTMREFLVNAHCNLFAYTTEEEFNSVYEELKNSIHKDSLTLLETTIFFQQLTSSVNNGHTEIDFPSQSYREYAQSGIGTLFPLELAFEDDKTLVRKNWSDNESIEIGSEVVSINGISMSEILSKIYRQVSAERTYFKNVKIEMYSFPRYYWQVFGEQNSFKIEIRTNQTVKKYLLKAIGLIEDYETRRTEVLNAQMNLRFINKTAYLNPGNFGGNEQKYRQFIDVAFVKIKKKNSDNLIIDLRNNTGGNNSFSDYLVSYIANKPFNWNSRLTLKTSEFLKEHTRQYNDTTDTYFQEILSRKNGEVYNYSFENHDPQPKSKRFEGHVYALINRQSHSQSALCAAQIQDYNFGTIVGEETGDYASLYGSQFQYQLPNTSIVVKVSKGYIVRVNGDTNEQGVIPDIYIRDHLLDETDEILSELLNRISE